MANLRPWIAGAILLLAHARLASAGLFTIAPDANNIPTILLDVETNTDLFMLGDDSLAFNGGLTLNSATGTFYAIANDSFGNSYLESFNLGGAGTLSQIAGLGTGFTSGLVFDPNDGNLYGLDNDFSVTGDTFFDRISLTGAVTQLMNLGQGFEGFDTGGLTFDPDSGLFYAIGADSSGVSRQLTSISLAGPISPIALLGDGTVAYNGGIFYDPAFGLISSLNTDTTGTSQLGAFMPNGQPFLGNSLYSWQGLTNVGLTAFVTVSSVPEPGTGVPAGLAVVLFVLIGRNSIGRAGTSGRRGQGRRDLRLRPPIG